jgi:hypothetical protein
MDAARTVDEKVEVHRKPQDDENQSLIHPVAKDFVIEI